MKKIFLFLVLCLCISAASARRYYCVIKGYDAAFSGKRMVWLDFGGHSKYRARPSIGENEKVADEDGKFFKLRSMVDAMNYLSAKGWVLQQTYSTALGEHSMMDCWVLYKDAETPEEAAEGILTQEEFEKKFYDGNLPRLE